MNDRREPPGRRPEPPRDPDTVPIPVPELRRRNGIEPPPKPWYLERPARVPQPVRLPRAQPPVQQQAPAQPEQPAQPETPASTAGRPRRFERVLLAASVAGLLLAGVLATVLAHRIFGVAGAIELDISTAQADISQILTDPINGYGVVGLGDVRCNNGHNPVIRQGAGFSCAVTVGGAQRQVAAVFTDDQGTYQVDRPR